jgi:hypothetical protein
MTKRKTKTKRTPTWRELFPQGRIIFYEGDDPKGFVREIKAKFGFDPSKDRLWKGGPVHFADHKGKQMTEPFSVERAFHCPPELLDEIYGTAKYPMGS